MNQNEDAQRILIRGALIVTLDADDRILPVDDILIEDGLISAIGEISPEVAESCDRIIDGTNRLVMPGLVNAHTHSPLSVVHGAYDLLNHRASMWLFQAYTANRTPREVYVSTMLNCIEMLLSGTTATLDHFPEQAFGPEDVEAAVSAYRDSGMRAQVALRIFDGEYTDILPPGGTLPEKLRADVERLDPYAPRSVPELRELCADSIERWHGDSGRIGIGPAPSNPIRSSDTLLEMCVEFVDRYGVGVHCHLLETEVQTRIAQDLYGTTTVRHLDDLGLLTSNLSCAHTIWIDDADIELMADRGASVVHNPESNLLSASGLAPIATMLARGLNVGLGSDGSCSSGDQAIHRAMKLATAIHRNGEPDRARWVSTRQALTMATAGGAAAMFAKGKFGALAIGQAADVVLYDLTCPWWTPVNNPIYQFVQSETGAGVDTVIVAGQVLVEGGRITAFDADSILAEARALVPAMKDRNRDLFEVVERVGEAVI
jgi:5-methylthioadenosine/S-adenosylhomocysteine deaminase